MAKITRTNSDSRRGLAVVEEDFRDEFDDFAPPAADLRDATVRPRTRVARTVPPMPEEGIEGEEPFLRVRRRVPVRRGPLPAWAKSRWGTVLLASLVLLAVGLLIFVILSVRHFLDHDPRFLIDSSASIQTTGNSELSRADLLSVFGADIGRNLFFVPLGVRAAELEDIPWVKHATVMRILPDQLRVSIIERTPVAFLRVGSNISLMDDEGVVLSMSPELMARHHFNFPVITGIDPAIPLAMRAQRIQLYQRFLAALDANGKHVSDQISEIDLADPEDVRATFSDRGHELLLHFGYTHFAIRYHTYVTHIQAWEQQYPHLASIDLRYDDQAVLRMATPNAPATGLTDGARTNPGVAKPVHHAAAHHHVMRHMHPTHHSTRGAR